jgi:hypothetical protein
MREMQCSWVADMCWGGGYEKQNVWMEMGTEMKDLGLMGAQREWNWCPDKGSVHGSMQPNGEPIYRNL